MRFQNGFESGELDKWCLGKVDDPAYLRGLARLENFSLLRSGGINRRKGYRLIDRILEIRPPEFLALDRDGGPEEYRETDGDTPGNGGEGRRRRLDTVFGTSESVARLIPLSADGGRTVLMYLTAQKYGFIEFSGAEAVRKGEHMWPAPPYIPASNIAQYNTADPEAYWEITGIGNLSSATGLDTGSALEIGGNAVMEPGRFTVTGEKAEPSGKLVSAAPFSIIPEARRMEGAAAVTQERVDAKGLAVSFFDEKGAGTGLRLTCTAAVKNETASLSFQILEKRGGGSGFLPDDGKDTTVLELVVENVGTIIAGATVSTAGSVMSVQDYKVRNYPAAGTGNAVMRWEAPPVRPGLYSEIYDWNGNGPKEPATLSVSVEELVTDEGAELGKRYAITFEVRESGSGFAKLGTTETARPVDKDGKFVGPVPAEKDIAFLKVAHVSDVGGTPCSRELRIVAELDGNGGIARVRDIPRWIDEDLAAYAAAEDAPGNAGDCFGKIMSADWFGRAYGVLEDGRASVEPPGKNGEGEDVPGFSNLAVGALAPFKYIANADGEGLFPWKGEDNSAYSEARRRSIGNGPVRVLQEFAGLWYGKTLVDWGMDSEISVNYPGNGPSGGYATRVLKYWRYRSYYFGAWYEDKSTGYYDIAYRNIRNGHLSYPLAYRSEKTADDKTRASWYEFDPFMATGCPKPVADPRYSAQPKLQWFDGAQKYIAPYANTLEKMKLGGREMWFLPPVPAKRGNGIPGYVMFGAFQDTAEGSYAVTKSGAYKGSGAVLEVESGFELPTAENPYGLLTVKIGVKNPGKNYLARSVDGIVLRCMPEGAGYAYEIPVFAARGSGGMLVLRNQDGTPLPNGVTGTEYTVAAKPVTSPPNPGDTVSLANAAGVIAAAACGVVPVRHDDGIHIKAWNVSLTVPSMPSGEPMSPAGFLKDNNAEYGEPLDASWNAGGSAFELKNASRVTEIFAARSYSFSLSGKGRFKSDPVKTTYYGSLGGKSYDITVTASRFVSQSVLRDIKEPKPGLYKVRTDETFGGMPSYWKWDGVAKKFTPAVMQVYPETDGVVNGLQYAYTGAVLILCGAGITPFTLRVDGGEIILGGVGVKTSADVETVAPKEFDLLPANTAQNGALPPLFMAAASVSPSVAAYINGRLWVAGLPDDPSRVYVSKPNRDRENTDFDFSTFKLVETVTPEYTPFEGSNKLGESAVTGVSDGALGHALAYAGFPVRDKKISFGYDRAFILATPYFSRGAYVESASGTLVLSEKSVAVAGEYTAEAAAKLRNKTGLCLTLCRLRVTVPGVSCNVNADCDGFEVRMALSTQQLGVSSSVGPFGGGTLAVPYTAWNSGPARVGVIAGATASVVSMAFFWGGGVLLLTALNNFDKHVEARLLMQGIRPNLSYLEANKQANMYATVTGTLRDPSKFLEYMQDSIKAGVNERDIAVLQQNIMMSPDGEATEEQRGRLAGLEARRIELSKNVTKRGALGSLTRDLGGLAQSLAMTAEGTLYATAGTAVTGILTAAGAAAGTLAAPGAGTVAGGMAGAALAGAPLLTGLFQQAYLNQKIYQGLEYEKLRKAGIEHSVARQYATVAAGLNTSIEAALGAAPIEGGVARIFGSVIGKKMLGGGIMEATAKQAMARFGKEAFINLSDTLLEGAEEAAQSVSSNLFLELAALRQDERFKSVVDWDAVDASKEDIGESFKAGVFMAFVLGIPKASVSAIAAGLTVSDAKELARYIDTVLSVVPDRDERRKIFNGGPVGRVLARNEIEEISLRNLPEANKFRTDAPAPVEGSPAPFRMGSGGKLKGNIGRDSFTFLDPAGFRYGEAKYSLSDNAVTVESIDIENKNITNPDALKAQVLRDIAKKFPGHEIEWNAGDGAEGRIRDAALRQIRIERDGAAHNELHNALGELLGSTAEVTRELPALTDAEKAEFEAAGDRVKGAFLPENALRMEKLIYLAKKADFTSLNHEMIHEKILSFGEDERREWADAVGLADNSAEGWNARTFDGRDGGKISAHEYIAEKWEDYLASPDNPAIPAKLKPLFDRIAAAMRRVYEALGRTAREVEPELKAMFDRLVEDGAANSGKNGGKTALGGKKGVPLGRTVRQNKGGNNVGTSMTDVSGLVNTYADVGNSGVSDKSNLDVGNSDTNVDSLKNASKAYENVGNKGTLFSLDGAEKRRADEIRAAAVMPRRAETISEAQKTVAELIKTNNTFTNRATGISAVISGKAINKLGFLKEEERALPPAVHALAVANIDRLFENAQVHTTHEDRHKDQNIKQIHRFGSVMEYNGEYYPVLITVKEFLREESTKLYSVEAIELKEIKKAAAWPPRLENSKMNGPAPAFYKSLADLIDTVKTPIVSDNSAEKSTPLSGAAGGTLPYRENAPLFSLEAESTGETEENTDNKGWKQKRMLSNQPNAVALSIMSLKY